MAGIKSKEFPWWIELLPERDLAEWQQWGMSNANLWISFSITRENGKAWCPKKATNLRRYFPGQMERLPTRWVAISGLKATVALIASSGNSMPCSAAYVTAFLQVSLISFGAGFQSAGPCFRLELSHSRLVLWHDMLSLHVMHIWAVGMPGCAEVSSDYQCLLTTWHEV